MIYRELGKTGLSVSEIGLGAEWLERHTTEECKEIIERCEAHGINILDCWMSEPNVRSNIGAAIEGRREKWYIQGHIEGDAPFADGLPQEHTNCGGEVKTQFSQNGHCLFLNVGFKRNAGRDFSH